MCRWPDRLDSPLVREVGRLYPEREAVGSRAVGSGLGSGAGVWASRRMYDMSTHARPRRLPRRAGRLLAALVVAIAFTGTLGAAHAAPSQQVDPYAPDFGPNVTVVDPATPLGEVQAMLDALAVAQVDAEMSTARHSVLFLPGEYGTTENPLQRGLATTPRSQVSAPRQATSTSPASSRSTTVVSPTAARRTASHW